MAQKPNQNNHNSETPKELFEASSLNPELQAEETLREQKNRAQKYFDIAGVILVVIDKNETVSQINQKGCEVLGYQEAEIIGKNWFDNFVPEEIRAEVKTVFAQLMAGEVEPVEYFENPVVTKIGEERIIAWHNTILHDDEGHIIGALSSGEDITAIKRAEKEIQQQNDFLNNVIESLAHPFYVIDIQDYTIKVANSTARQWFDLSAPATCHALTHHSSNPCGSVKHPCPIEAVKQTKKPVTVEHIHYDNKGNPRNVEVHGYPIFDREGNVIQMIEYSLDVTKRKEAEEALRHERDNFISILNTMADGVYIANHQYDIEYANPALQREFGPFEGLKCYQYLKGRKEVCPWCPNRDVFGGRKVRWEWYSPQTQKTYDIIATPLKNADGSISKLEILRDITAKKRQEEQMQLSLKEKEAVLKEMQQRVDIAAEIQRSLLPTEFPQETGLEISATNIMARNVGGDYYDSVLNPSGQLAFVIADVMGKDIPAALLMTMVRVIWRNNVMVSKSPDDILSALNQSLYSDFNGSGRFVSMFNALYDPSTFTLRYSNGGHNPPLYLPYDSDRFEPLDTDGMLIGILPDSKYAVAQRVLNEGDLIVVYTDGIVEAERDEALFGTERLQEVIIQNRCCAVKEIQTKIISDVRKYTQGEPQSDDLTLMVLRVAVR